MARDDFKELKQAASFVNWTWRIGAGTLKLGVGAYQLAKACEPPPEPKKIDPMDGLATRDELQNYTYDPDGFYLGRIHPDHGVNFESSLSSQDDRHVFIVAGSASGKGVTYGIQNAIRWKGPLFAIDPKGEMAEIAGSRRGTRQNARGSGSMVNQFVGQKVAILDPMGEVDGPAKKYRVNYDPMRDIDRRNVKQARRRIKRLASGCIIPEEGSNSHFSESAETILAGAIEAVLWLEQPQDHSLPFVRQKILGNKVKKQNGERRETNFSNVDKALVPFERILGTRRTQKIDDTLNGKDKEDIRIGFEALYDYLISDGVPDDGYAAEAASVIAEILGSDEGGSFRTTLSRNLKWLIDGYMQDHLKPSNFSLWEAIQEGWSVFIVLNPDDIGDFRNWLRMTTQLALSAKMAMGKHQTGMQTLFFLDEFPVLGRFREIEQKAGYIRGYGVKLVPIIQNVGQLEELYGKNWETFLGNAGAVIGWGFNDGGTEQYFSKRLGSIEIEQTSTSTTTSTQGLGASFSYSQQDGRYDKLVRFPNQVREECARETMRAFVIPARGKAFTVERVAYMELEEERVYDSPEHIIQWEKSYG